MSDTAVTDRLHDIVVRSPAMEGEQTLRVLLPTGYDPQAAQPYPVLYLLHGCCDDHRSWYDKTDLADFTARMPVVIVMPDAGPIGYYSDWYNNGLGGTPRWETYHIRELMPWVESTYRVRRERAGRMLSGLSMGGHGSFAYAARYPDRFASASAFSPAVDTNAPEGIGWVFLDALTPLGAGPPGSIWGNRATEDVRWRGHNPFDLAENLSTVALFLRTGDGTDANGAPSDAVEFYVHAQAVNLHNELLRLDIPHFFEDYGPGGHTWDKWQEDLHLILPQQLALARLARAAPRAFSYRSIEPVFSIYGWEVSIERSVIEFARLGEVSAAGFTLSGSGRAAVTTAAWYAPGADYTIDIDGVPATVAADADGRVHLQIDLGPPRTLQQYRVGSEDGFLRSVAVTIAPAR